MTKEGNHDWHKMVKFFKGLRVNVSVPVKVRDAIKTIKGFEPEGGNYMFVFQEKPITVKVSFLSVYVFLLMTSMVGLLQVGVPGYCQAP